MDNESEFENVLRKADEAFDLMVQGKNLPQNNESDDAFGEIEVETVWRNGGTNAFLSIRNGKFVLRIPKEHSGLPLEANQVIRVEHHPYRDNFESTPLPQEETIMVQLPKLQTAKGLFGRLKRVVRFAFIGGGVGAAAVLLAPAIFQSAAVLIGGFVGGAVVAKMTGKKSQ
jgi:hypothetical protein